MNFRRRLLDLIDRTGESDWKISRLATRNNATVRNIRRGASPRLDTLEALCRALGVRLEMVPLDEPGQASDVTRTVAKRPEWSRRLREEIRRDFIEILGQGTVELPGGTERSGDTGEKKARQASRRLAP